MLYKSKKIYVDESNVHGRGVFASESIKKGEILEECHFILAPQGDYPKILTEHFFAWPKFGNDGVAICLGYGSIYNHSANDPSADWETDPQKLKFIFYAIRDIQKGEEIFLDYKKNGQI